MQDGINFGQIALRHLFWGKLTKVTFVNLLCPIILKCLNLKKSLQRIIIYRVLQFWSKLGRNCRVFLLGQGIRWSPARAKNLLIFSLTTRKNSPFCRLPTNFYPPSTMYQFPWCNPVKTFLAFTCFYCCSTILILTLYSLYIPVMLILISINVQCLQNVHFSFEKGSNSQDHSSSDSHNPIKKFSLQQNLQLH